MKIPRPIFGGLVLRFNFLFLFEKAPKSDKQNGVIKGYYVGYKVYNSSTPYNYVTRPVYDDFTPEFSIINLEKFTRYTMHVQAFNAKGAGPKSADRMVLTLEDGMFLSLCLHDSM